MLQRCQKKRSEPTSFALNGVQDFTSQQVQEETLNQIGRILGTAPSAEQV
jgi:hypothetical protein